jgi:arsenate reductase-like glutaredoxin family protein
MTDTEVKTERTDAQKEKDAATRAVLKKIVELAETEFEELVDTPKEDWPEPDTIAERATSQLSEEECRLLAEALLLRTILRIAQKVMTTSIPVVVMGKDDLLKLLGE